MSVRKNKGDEGKNEGETGSDKGERGSSVSCIMDHLNECKSHLHSSHRIDPHRG